MTMQKNLKSRAKRLRPAIEKMFGVSVTHSQSLELVAKEENYPHWDAACASFGQAIHPASDGLPVHVLEIEHYPGQKPTFASTFSGNPSLKASILDFLGGTSGGLLLLSGLVGNGLTTSISKVIDEATALGHDKIDLYVWVQEHLYPDNVRCHDHEKDVTILGSASNGAKIIFIDDLRTSRAAFEAVLLANSGFKVVVGLNAIDPLKRMKYFLGEFGVGMKELDILIQKGEVIPVYQTLRVSDKASVLAIRAERLNRMRKIHGNECIDSMMGTPPKNE